MPTTTIPPHRLGGIPLDLVMVDIAATEPGSVAWVNDRSKGLGASEVAEAIGMSPWASPWTLWHRKKKLAPPIEDNEAMYWGRALEGAIVNRWQEDHEGAHVTQPWLTFRHPEISWAWSSPDAFVDDDGMLEVKTTGFHDRQSWEGDSIPSHYMIQAQWSLMVTGRQWCDLAVLIAGQDYRVKRTHRDERLFASLLERAEHFWQMLQNDIRPDPDHRDDVNSVYPEESPGEVIEMGNIAAGWVREYRQARKEENEAKRTKMTLGNQLKDYMKTAAEMVEPEERILGVDPDVEAIHNDRLVATWKCRTDGVRVLRIPD